MLNSFKYELGCPIEILNSANLDLTSISRLANIADEVE